ncbi:hypothetical protein EDB92DRAFT_1818336 [Lactarius akahatsu]|uniref:Fungal STAND N-terminal Goodbye domain-containing protein n=1 Tax=Lactarius akahatsu TaxID=416441 RepID=A0AAD4LA55_9AGAM|nr:hypothetical protein EDB92DRAFT_1818336 [Lactarius akahatsu]
MSSTSFQLILDVAIADYAKQTGIDPIKHPFADRLQTSHSPDDILKLLGDKASEFENYREGNRELIGCLKPVVTVIHAFSGFLGGAVSLYVYPDILRLHSLNVIWTPQAACGVSSSYDALVDLFDCVGNFLKRLRVYTNLPLDPSLTEICVKIMVELLSVLALATKQIKQGRFSKWALVFDMRQLNVSQRNSQRNC